MTDKDDDREVFESSSLVCDQCGAEPAAALPGFETMPTVLIACI